MSPETREEITVSLRLPQRQPAAAYSPTNSLIRDIREIRAFAERAIKDRRVVRQFVPALVRAPDYGQDVESEWPDASPMLLARINTGGIDRHDTIVDPTGADVEEFTRNPVLMYQHGLDPARGELPLGVVTELTLDPQYIDAMCEFDSPADPFAEMVLGKYRRGVMRGFSIGFLPRAYAIDNMPGADGGNFEVLRYTDWCLVELSCVAVPSNPDALSA